ncbi:uncharacterized protein LOC125491246 isoform X3 [Plutella xylostella]|nr:uncharacterized protein LOC125491246 isoform X3 [Plutella xylostella]
MVQISSSMRSYAIFPRPRWFYKAMPRLPSMPSHDDAAGGAAAAGWPASNGAAVSAPAATAPFTTQISVPVCSGAGTGAAPPVAAAAICGAAAGAVCAVADHGGGAAVRRGLFVESPRWWQGPLVAWSGRGGRHGRGAGRGGARSQSWAQSRPRHLWSVGLLNLSYAENRAHIYQYRYVPVAPARTPRGRRRHVRCRCRRRMRRGRPRRWRRRSPRLVRREPAVVARAARGVVGARRAPWPRGGAGGGGSLAVVGAVAAAAPLVDISTGMFRYPPWPPSPYAVPLPAPCAPWPTTEVAPSFAAA